MIKFSTNYSEKLCVFFLKESGFKNKAKRTVVQKLGVLRAHFCLIRRISLKENYSEL